MLAPRAQQTQCLCFVFTITLQINWVCLVSSAFLVMVSMMNSTLWDVMSEHTVREMAAFYSVLSTNGVMESSVNIWLNHNWSVNVCRILCMRSGCSSLKLVQYFIMRNPETTYTLASWCKSTGTLFYLTTITCYFQLVHLSHCKSPLTDPQHPQHCRSRKWQMTASRPK
jgi:hypothetical protein